jgi:hypothetical protein
VLVFVAGFFGLGVAGYLNSTQEPPSPARVVDPGGRTVFTGEDVTAGQKVFLANGLMKYGSVFGLGAYLGPDFTADYLHRSIAAMRSTYGTLGAGGAALPQRPPAIRIAAAQSSAGTTTMTKTAMSTAARQPPASHDPGCSPSTPVIAAAPRSERPPSGLPRQRLSPRRTPSPDRPTRRANLDESPFAWSH